MPTSARPERSLGRGWLLLKKLSVPQKSNVSLRCPTILPTQWANVSRLDWSADGKSLIVATPAEHRSTLP